MKTLLDKATLVQTAASKARGSKMGLVFFCVAYLLFSVVMVMFSWILGLCFAAFMALMGYFLYLSVKEKHALAKDIKAGNFKILREPIFKKEQELLGKIRCYYFYLDEKRRVNVDADVFLDELAGHDLYTVYVADAKMPAFVYTEKDHTLGKSLRGYLVQPVDEQPE